MAEVLSPHRPSPSPSPADSSDSVLGLSASQPRPQPKERVPSYAQSRMSQYSKSSQRSRPQSTNTEYPAFASSLPYTLVRDFAYPVFYPLHYGPQPESSGASTPTSEFHTGRRQSDPMEHFNNSTSGSSGWSAGPWGGDGVMYGDPDESDNIAALPSTSFGSSEEGGVEGDNDGLVSRNKHRKSKSYANISEFERGRRRDSSGRRSRDVQDPHMFYFHGSQTDPAGRDRLRQSRGYSNTGTADGLRHDSHSTAATLPNRSFHHSQNAAPAQPSTDYSDDEQIPLDTEPHASHSPVRVSMGPEDEELFAGPSLALYAFEPENSNELRLVEGQEIMVSYRHGQGWLVASDPRSGEQGLVPEAYVRLIADMPNYDPVTGEFVDVDEEEIHDVDEGTSRMDGVEDDSKVEDTEMDDAAETPNATDSTDKKLGHEEAKS